jgi:hypothetical protein
MVAVSRSHKALSQRFGVRDRNFGQYESHSGTDKSIERATSADCGFPGKRHVDVAQLTE